MLCTGRSGSTSFYRACRHITNYTSGHELNTSELGEERFAYPDRHIEIDNRLSWLLGRLDTVFGDRAFYVHLIREEHATAQSFDKRWSGRYSIIRAYAEGVLRRKDQGEHLCVDYYRTVNQNISLFLKDKSQKMTVQLEETADHFPIFWERIGAEGDLGAALREFEVKHNRSAGPAARAYRDLLWRMRRSLG